MDKMLRPALLLLLAIALMGSVWMIVERIKVEQANKNVEITVFWEEVLQLAKESDEDWSGILLKLKEKGVTSVLMKEDTPLNLLHRGELRILSGQDLLLFTEFSEKPAPWLKTLVDSPDFRTEYNYLLTQETEVYERLYRNLSVKSQGLRKFTEAGVLVPAEDSEDVAWYVLATPLTLSQLDFVGIGFSVETMKEIGDLGLYITPQLRSWSELTPEALAVSLDSFKQINNLSSVFFNDKDVPGFPKRDYLEEVAEGLGELEIPVGQIEFFPQKGLDTIINLMDQKVVRMHTISEGELAKYSPATATDRFQLAVSERNMRVLFVRFFQQSVGEQRVTDNLAYLERLSSNLESRGFDMGRAEVFRELSTPNWLLGLIGLGVIAGGLLLGLLWQWPAKYLVPLGVLAMLGWLGLVLLGKVGLPRLGLAFVAVVIAPLYSLSANLKLAERTFGDTVITFVKVCATTFLGAILLMGLMADTVFLVKLQQFRAVKLAHLIPIALIILYLHYTLTKGKRQIEIAKQLLQEPIRVSTGIVLVLLAVGLLVYITRTGNEGVALVPTWEIQMRAFLDKWLLVRPRTKEFLIGLPVLFFLLYRGIRHWAYLPLVVLAAIGQISLVNTYAHIHTPVLVSLLRSFNGLWLGLVLGIAAVFLWRMGEKVRKHYGI